MLANRVREYTTTVGTGDITLGGALAGHLRFTDAFATGDSVIYVIEDGDNYEIGTGTLTSGTILARTSISETLIDGVLDKDAPAAISLSGTARIYCAVSAEYLLNPTKEADVIREVTPGAGVFVDGVHLKDGGGTFSGMGSFTGHVNTGGFIQSQADDFQVRIDRGTSENWFLRHTADDRFALHRNATGDALSFDASLDASFAGSVTVNQAGQESTGLQVGSGNSGILQLSENPAYNIKAGTWWPGLRLYAPDRVIAFVDDNPVLTITSAEASFAGDVLIGGDLKFSGSATVIDTTTINTGDNIIVLNADVTGTPTENAGIEIERGSAPNASILWNENTDTFELSSGATFMGNITSGNHTVSDHLAVTGSGNARVTIGSTSGAASGATLNINGWSGTDTINNRIVGYGSDGGGVRIDVDGTPAALFDRFLKASFFGALDVAGRVDFSETVTHNRASGAVNTIFSRGDTDANVAVQFRGATYNTYFGTDHSGAFSIGPSADLNAGAVFRVNPLTGRLSVNGDVTTTHRLGVGTNNIPAWVNGWDSIDFGGAASFMSSSSSASFLQGVNWYYDGSNYVRKLAAGASRLILNPDYIGFQLAESGAAGSNISWVTALGIDADHNAVFSGNLTATGQLTVDGGAKISVMNQADGGNSQGLFLYDTDNTGYGIYMASAGANKSLGNGTACTPLNGDTGFQTRTRVGNVPGQGLIWENSNEQCLMSLTADTGYLYTKGSAHFNRSGALGTMLSMLGDNSYTHTINNAGIGNELVFNVNSSGAAVEFQASSTPYFSANPTQASFGASADTSLASDNGVVVISASHSGTSRAGVSLQGYRIAADVGVLGAFRFHNHNSLDLANKKQVASIEAWSEGVNTEAGRLKFFTNNGAGAVIERGHITGGGQWSFNNNALAGVAEIQIGTRERIIRDGATGALGVSGGSHEDLGGNVKLFGEGNLGNEGNIELRTNTSVRAQWNNELNLWDWRENNFLDVGDVTLAGDLIARNVDDGPMEVRSGTANNRGGALVLFGDTHPTVAGDIVLKSNADWVLHYSRRESAWNFTSRNIVNAANVYRAESASVLGLSGGSSQTQGGNILLFGENHATQAHDIQIRGGANTRLLWDNSAGFWNFQNLQLNSVGSLVRGVGTTQIILSGGVDNNSGANITLYGESHATQARDIIFRTDNTQVLAYDSSEGEWDFKSKHIITEGNLQVHSLVVKSGTQLGNGSWPLSSVGNGADRVGIISDEENAMLVMANMTAGIAAGKGGDIILGGRATAGSDDFGGARIAGAKENGTSGDYRGYMSLATSNSGGTLTEAIRINSSQATVFRNDVQVEGNSLTVGANTNVPVIIAGKSNRTNAGDEILALRANWNDTPVAQINLRAGDDAVAKDGGVIGFSVAADGGVMGEALLINSDKSTVFSSDVTLGVDHSLYLRGGINSYRGIIPEPDINLMLGSGAGDEPRIYLHGSQNGEANAGDIFFGTAGNNGLVTVQGQFNATHQPASMSGSNLANAVILAGSPSLGVGIDTNEITQKGDDLYLISSDADSSVYIYGANTPIARFNGTDLSSRFDGDIISGGYQYRTTSTDSAILSGGSAINAGANLVLYGQNHATLANDFRLRSGPEDVLHYSAFQNQFDFKTQDVSNVGKLTVGGGAKISVQNAQNGGAEHGLFWHDTGNTSWVSYMATASGQTPHATTPCLSLDGRNSWHVRTRVNGSGTEGILWENDDDQCLMSLTSDTGDLYTKGNVKTGDAFVVGVNGSVIGSFTAGSVYLSGGTSNNEGANIVLRAQLHADAGDFQVRNGTNVALALDASAAEWDFQNNDLTTTGKITASYLEYIGGPRDQVGTGNPEGIVAAPVGSTFRRTDGFAGGTLYVKSAGGTGSAGWEVAGSGGSSEWIQIHSAAPTGASVDVAGIPSGINEVKILIRGVGSSGAGNFSLQLGNTSALETAGYLGGVCSMEDDAGVAGNSTSFGSAFVLHSDASNDTRHSEITLTRFAGHAWVISFNFINDSGTEQVAVGAGEKTLSSALSTIRFNAGGASTFSGGNIRVAYR